MPHNTNSPMAVLAAVCIAQFMAPMMFTAVNVALPAMGSELGGSALQLGLVEQVYVLALAMAMLTFGRLGDLVGRRKVFLAGLVAFTAFTCALGFAPSMDVLIGLRFFQGLGGAMLLSGSMALVATAFPPQSRGKIIGIVSGVTYAGLTLGPALGGLLTTTLGWRSIFWAVAPFGLAGCIVSSAGLRDPEHSTAEGESLQDMDWLGGVLYAASIASAMIGAAQAGASSAGAVLVALGLGGLVLFTLYERRKANPLVDVGLFFSNRYFSLSCLAAFAIYASTAGATFFISLYLQYAQGLSPQQAGYALLLQPLMQMLLSPLAGRLADRFPPGILASLGAALHCVGLALAAFFLDAESSVAAVAVVLLLAGAGSGLFISPNTVAIMASVTPRHYGLASGMIGAMRTLGLAGSMSLATAFVAFFMGGKAVALETMPEFLLSMHVSLVVFAVVSGSCVLLSLSRGRGSDA